MYSIVIVMRGEVSPSLRKKMRSIAPLFFVKAICIDVFIIVSSFIKLL